MVPLKRGSFLSPEALLVVAAAPVAAAVVLTVGVAVERSREDTVGENRSSESSSKLPLANRSWESFDVGLDLVFLLESESDLASDLEPK